MLIICDHHNLTLNLAIGRSHDLNQHLQWWCVQSTETQQLCRIWIGPPTARWGLLCPCRHNFLPEVIQWLEVLLYLKEWLFWLHRAVELPVSLFMILLRYILRFTGVHPLWVSAKLIIIDASVFKSQSNVFWILSSCIYLIIKMNNCWGALTDYSARTAALIIIRCVTTDVVCEVSPKLRSVHPGQWFMLLHAAFDLHASIF